MTEIPTLLAGAVLTLMLHASVLLGLVWVAERGGWLRHPGWAETAWRGALFGALLSAAAGSTLPLLREPSPARDASVGAGVRAALTHPGVAPAAVVDAASPRAARAQPAMPQTPMSAVQATTPAAGAAPPQSGQTRVAWPRGLAQALAAGWLTTTLLWLTLTLRRARQVRELRRRVACATPAPAWLQRQAATLATRLATAPPRLHLIDALPSPVALPGACILLPHWVADLEAPRAHALLAHEIAHLARRDPAWRLAAHLALAPLLLHPLAWLALRRLDALAEVQADAAAARLHGDGRALAECLALCLAQQQLPSPFVPRFALAMTGRPGAVVDRVQRLLEEDPMRYARFSRPLARAALALGIVAALSLPAVTVVPLAQAGGLFSGNSISIHEDDDGRRELELSISRSGYALEVEMEGRVTFLDDESDVARMDADARLTIEETQQGVTRRIVFGSGSGGVAREYAVDGRPRSLDAEGRAWLARVLPEMFRASGIDAPARAARILARGGVEALLGEIALIEGDYARRCYLAELFTLARLDAAQFTRAVTLIDAIGSDYEKRTALEHALGSTTLVPAQQAALLTSAAGIDSDFERAEVLLEAMPRFVLDPTTLPAWSAAFEGIDSDYEQRRVLQELLTRHGDNPDAVRIALRAGATIGSDFEQRQLLEAAATRALADPDLQVAFLALLNDIGSDYEKYQALLAAMQAVPLDVDFSTALLDSIDGIGSDYEAKEALVALATRMPHDASLIERYRASARRLGDHERGEAERALDRFFVAR